MDEQTTLHKAREASSNWDLSAVFDLGELIFELPGLVWDGLGWLLEFVISGLLEGLGALF